MSLNPHVVGRFFRAYTQQEEALRWCLNPHVVGRFFREYADIVKELLG